MAEKEQEAAIHFNEIAQEPSEISPLNFYKRRLLGLYGWPDNAAQAGSTRSWWGLVPPPKNL
jgi:hypothetical protein